MRGITEAFASLDQPWKQLMDRCRRGALTPSLFQQAKARFARALSRRHPIDAPPPLAGLALTRYEETQRAGARSLLLRHTPLAPDAAGIVLDYWTPTLDKDALRRWLLDEVDEVDHRAIEDFVAEYSGDSLALLDLDFVPREKRNAQWLQKLQGLGGELTELSVECATAAAWGLTPDTDAFPAVRILNLRDDTDVVRHFSFAGMKHLEIIRATDLDLAHRFPQFRFEFQLAICWDDPPRGGRIAPNANCGAWISEDPARAVFDPCVQAARQLPASSFERFPDREFGKRIRKEVAMKPLAHDECRCFLVRSAKPAGDRFLALSARDRRLYIQVRPAPMSNKNFVPFVDAQVRDPSCLDELDLVSWSGVQQPTGSFEWVPLLQQVRDDKRLAAPSC